jgi:hypothetical protein
MRVESGIQGLLYFYSHEIELLFFISFLLMAYTGRAAYILIPMDDTQTNHLKAYGVAYKVLLQNLDVKWLLNYRGGSFLID